MAVLLAASWSLMWPDRLQRLALATPARFIALTGGLLWLKFDLAWKLAQWPTTHDSAGTVRCTCSPAAPRSSARARQWAG
jgi:hypothetical protein